MFSAFVNSFKIPELRKRILFTFGLLFVSRIVANVPIPGVNLTALQSIIANIESDVGGGFLGLIDLFTGGALQQCAIGALGILPYISASIILQLMTAVVPSLERLAREGDVGRQRITQIARYLTIGICIVQGLAAAFMLERPGSIGLVGDLVYEPGWPFRLMTVLTLTTGAMMVMWLGEHITEHGVGNGVSLIITVNIASRLPDAIYSTFRMFQKVDGVQQFTIFHLAGMLFMFFVVTAATVAITQGQRRIPIHTTKRVVGRKVYGGQNTYMPLRVNYSGVMPLIFAQSILAFPAMMLSQVPSSWTMLRGVADAMNNMTGWVYLSIYGFMILFFSYFWVATQFNPLQIADDLKKNGGYVPGIRPGRPTSDFLDRTMTRVTLVGALFLTIIAVIPSVMSHQFKISWMVASFFGGTSQLIMVGVMLDTMRQVESHLLMRHYDGFLRKGKLRGRK
jgi:preprotein translocase subunit SecY